MRLFENVDCGPGGPEGNYRQRLYRLRTLMADAGLSSGVEGAAAAAAAGHVPPVAPEHGNASYGMAA
jgi:hypothetical protein